MPTYVYRCRDCQKTIEVVQRFSDDPLTLCPHCGGNLSRLLFPPAIVFKGSGWYCTDHRKSSPGNGSNGDSEGDKAGKEKEHESEVKRGTV